MREEEGAAAESAPRRPPRPALPSSRRDYWGADAGGAPPRCWPLCGHSSFIHQAHCRPSLQSPNFPSPAMGPLVVGCERKSGRMERALAAGCPGRWGAGGLQVWGGFASARSPHLPPSLAQSNVNPVPARSPPGPWRRRRQAPQPLLWGGGALDLPEHRLQRLGGGEGPSPGGAAWALPPTLPGLHLGHQAPSSARPNSGPCLGALPPRGGSSCSTSHPTVGGGCSPALRGPFCGPEPWETLWGAWVGLRVQALEPGGAGGIS